MDCQSDKRLVLRVNNKEGAGFIKAKELIQEIMSLNPDEDTEIDILLCDPETDIYDFLNIRNVVRNADCSGINAIGINVKLSHTLMGK